MFRLLARIAYTILVLIEALVAIRFVLIMISANRANELVNMVFNYSDKFVNPFIGIASISNMNIIGLTFDITTLIALAFYMILAYVCIELIKAFSRE